MDALTEALLESTADLLAFLELSDDSVVDPDAAVVQMEAVAGRLQSLTTSDRRVLTDAIHALAIRQEREDRRSFVQDLPNSLGIT